MVEVEHDEVMKAPLGLQHLPADELTSAGPGFIHIGVLHQDRAWVDEAGAVHDLAKMSSAYRLNVIGHLLRKLGDLYALERRWRLIDAFEVGLAGLPPVPADPMPAEPIAWLEGTLLVRRLRELESQIASST